MGLDVTLYKKGKDFHKWVENEDNEEEANFSPEEKAKAEELQKLEMDALEDDCTEEVVEDSKKYPDHFFKLGYFRSSYNSGGFNQVVGNLIGEDLYSIFEVDRSYTVCPDWEGAKKRAEKALKKLRKLIKDGNNCRVLRFAPNEFGGGGNVIKSEEDALELFLKEKKENRKGLSRMFNYSSSKGEFYFSRPLEMVGVIHGSTKSYITPGKEEVPCAYIIFKQDLTSYVESLEIVIETIKYVLDKKNPEHYFFHWSA